MLLSRWCIYLPTSLTPGCDGLNGCGRPVCAFSDGCTDACCGNGLTDRTVDGDAPLDDDEEEDEEEEEDERFDGDSESLPLSLFDDESSSLDGVVGGGSQPATVDANSHRRDVGLNASASGHR